MLVLPLDESDDDDSSSESSSGEDTDAEDSDWDQSQPVSQKRRRQITERILQQSLQSGMYPTFLGTHGPSQPLDPRHNNALVYFQRVWPVELCELIADQTNLYMVKREAKGAATTAREMWVFLGMVLAMGVHRVPRYCNYWSRDDFLGVRALSDCMTRDRFNYLRRNLHLVDDDTVVEKDRYYKVKPLVDILQTTFLRNYFPSQEIVVDELMIKCKGRAKGKVVMPKKPVKRGFKVWSLSCSCCGYLCNFEIYAGKCTDKREVGLAQKVVLSLVEPFEGINHVLYTDNYFSSVDLTRKLRRKQIYTVGTTRADSRGLPASLKGKSLKKQIEKGDYRCATVGRGESLVHCFAYHDRNLVRFVTNAFPLSMTTKGVVREASGLLVKRDIPPLVPAYNKFMGAVDRTGQLRKYYGNDRRCMRPWLRIFFHLFDLAVNNAFLLYKHDCKRCKVKPNDLLAFRTELVHTLLDGVRKSRKRPALPQPCPDGASDPCRLARVKDVLDREGKPLKKGKCYNCLQKRPKKCSFTSYACSHCRVRLCLIPCYDEYHKC